MSPAFSFFIKCLAIADRRGSARFVSFVDVFAPNNAVDYIKEHIREGLLPLQYFFFFFFVLTSRQCIPFKPNTRNLFLGVQVYVSGQLRSRMRTDEDGRPFQDVRVQANGLFKIVDPKHIMEESSAAGEDVETVFAETKQQQNAPRTSEKTTVSE